MVAGPFLVPIPVSLPSTAPLLTAIDNTIVPDNRYTSVPADPYNTVDPVPVPTTTTTTTSPEILPTTTSVPVNSYNIVAPAPESTISTTSPSNHPTHIVHEPDITNTTCVYANPNTQNSHVPNPNPYTTHVALLPDTPSYTTSTPTVVADFHGVKWCDSKNVIDLDEVTSLHWKFINHFVDPVYPNSGVWMFRLDAWFMMYGEKYFLLSLTTLT